MPMPPKQVFPYQPPSRHRAPGATTSHFDPLPSKLDGLGLVTSLVRPGRGSRPRSLLGIAIGRFLGQPKRPEARDLRGLRRSGVLGFRGYLAWWRLHLELFLCAPPASPISGHSVRPSDRAPQSVRRREPLAPIPASEMRPRSVPASAASAFSVHGLTVFAPSPSPAPFTVEASEPWTNSPDTEPPAPDRAGRFPFRLGASHRRDSGMVKRKYVPRISGADFQFWNTTYRNHPK